MTNSTRRHAARQPFLLQHFGSDEGRFGERQSGRNKSTVSVGGLERAHKETVTMNHETVSVFCFFPP